MTVSPDQQRCPRLTRLLPTVAHILWYVVAIVVGRVLHSGPFDCQHAFLPCAVTTPFSAVLVTGGALGLICLAGYGITTVSASGPRTDAVPDPFLKDWFQIAVSLINPVIYAAAVALGIAMFAVQQLWFAFAFVFGGGLGLFMQMPTLISLIRETTQ